MADVFFFGKCICLHTENGNLDINYKMGDPALGTTVKENEILSGYENVHRNRFLT